ncbi:anthranilate phosphoribosyltransferase [Fictibacillus enclensis]|uniref:Glycosyl transferase n=1 Tax=Fictibacillus enclensis TaxID=1017270 RepID=A0A0V8JEW9_9BACL|nr:glycosyl transferase [Fictibacillus enclensis]KSU85498.1 glycosyl transferase [Fictibacillus enclensis]SCB97808.1 anthranilate phosphoribosyltransferase [Fictibacillus enclensis]
MQKWIKEVGRGKRGAKNLSYEEALEAAKCITSGEATEAQMAAFLMAERIKTESPDELLAFIHEFRRHTQRLEEPRAAGGILDCGGPYNGRNSFAATIPVNILLSQQGLPVFLHASESLPPKNGTSLKTILEKLSVPVAQTKGEVLAALEAVNIGFAWTDKLCPPLADLRKIREEMGVRTIMNTVEKLLDMSGANSIILGVFHRTAVNKIVPSLQQLNYERAYIVQGVEGSEDLPVHRSSFIYNISTESSESIIIDPSDYGLKHEKELNKEVLSADEQAGLMTQLLAGEQSDALLPYRNQVVLNAGLRFYLLGHTPTIEEGTQLADRLLSQKKGEEQLILWRGVLQGSIDS